MMKTKLLASTLTLGLASGALALGLNPAPAKAATPFVNWSGLVNVGFCTWAPPQVDPTIPGDLTEGCGSSQGGVTGFKKLSWGTAPSGQQDDRSMLLLNNTNGTEAVPGMTGMPITNPGSFTTNSGVFTGPLFSITHFNNPINSENNEPFLSDAQLLTDFLLTPSDGGLNQDLGVVPYGIKFLETPNSPGGGICVNGQPAVGGDPFAPGFGCPDIFVLDTIAGVQVPGNLLPGGILPLPTRTFSYGGNDYKVFTQVSDLVVLTPLECQVTVGRDSCVGLLTTENQNKTVKISARIDGMMPMNVPEPSSLAGLLTVGLAGLGWLGKRKKAE